MKREWTDDMGEISGFGGGYEAACRAMVFAGLDWFDAHPKAAPQFGRFSMAENADAVALDAAMVEVTKDKGGCTGAMHGAALSHVLFAHKNGWEKYAAELRKREREEAAGAK